VWSRLFQIDEMPISEMRPEFQKQMAALKHEAIFVVMSCRVVS
jgi:hypothetical protein